MKCPYTIQRFTSLSINSKHHNSLVPFVCQWLKSQWPLIRFLPRTRDMSYQVPLVQEEKRKHLVRRFPIRSQLTLCLWRELRIDRKTWWSHEPGFPYKRKDHEFATPRWFQLSWVNGQCRDAEHQTWWIERRGSKEEPWLRSKVQNHEALYAPVQYPKTQRQQQYFKSYGGQQPWSLPGMSFYRFNLDRLSGKHIPSWYGLCCRRTGRFLDDMN